MNVEPAGNGARDPVSLEEAREILERLSRDTEGSSMQFWDYNIYFEKLIVQDVQKEDS